MRYKASALAVIMVLALTVMPASVSDETTYAQKPCLDAEIKRAEAEEKLKAQSALLEACHLHLDELKKENRRLKALADDEHGKLVAVSSSYQGAQRRVGALETAGTEKDAALAAQKDMTAKATAERDALARKIKAGNGRFLCEAFSLGCIK